MIVLDIKMLEQLSQIKAHTIRIWEHRFNLFQPSRTPGNKRIYQVNDLKHLLDLAILSKHGFPISKLANHTPAILQSRISQLNTSTAIRDASFNRLIISYVQGEISSFEDNLTAYSLNAGIHHCIIDMIIPFIERVGLFYYVDQKPSTHFVVTALRKKLLHATDSLTLRASKKQSALLFLPPNQHFDLLLLSVAYQLQLHGIKVFYLGTNVSSDIVETVVRQYNPDFLVTYLSESSRTNRSEKLFLDDLVVTHKNLIVTAAKVENTASSYGQPIPYHSILQHFTS